MLNLISLLWFLFKFHCVLGFFFFFKVISYAIEFVFLFVLKLCCFRKRDILLLTQMKSNYSYQIRFFSFIPAFCKTYFVFQFYARLFVGDATREHWSKSFSVKSAQQLS